MNSFTILHVEDDPNDVFLVRRAFAKAGLAVRLEAISSGDQALEYLSATGPYADRERYPLPDLVLLDLKLPGLNGFEVLDWIRATGVLRGAPVVILSSSDHPDDRQRAAELEVAQYFTKSATFTEAVDYVRRMLPVSATIAGEPALGC